MHRPTFPSATVLFLGLAMTSPASAQLTSFDADADGVSDDADYFPCDSTISAVAYAPGQDQHDMLMFEDQWPAAGDLDFNDLDVAYNFVFRLDPSGRVDSIRITLNFLALGGDMDTGLALHLPVPTNVVASAIARVGRHDDESTVTTTQLSPSALDSQFTVDLSDRVRDLLDAPATEKSGPKNSIAGQAPVTSFVMEVEISFFSPLSLSVAEAPYDLFLFRTVSKDYEVHRTAFAGSSRMDTGLFNTADDASSPGRYFVDGNGLPFALIVPDSSLWPSEATPIDQLYPDIVGFASSGGTQNKDYYQSTVVSSAAYTEAGRPTPQFLAPSSSAPTTDTACAPRCDDGLLNGHETDVDCGADCGACPSGARCQSDSDCGGQDTCRSGVCTTPSCNDGIRNNWESDVDCGGNQVVGPQCRRCPNNRNCNRDSDCASHFCWGGNAHCENRE